MRMIKMLPYLLLILAFSLTLQPAAGGTSIHTERTARAGRMELDTRLFMPSRADVKMLNGESYGSDSDPACCLMGMCKNCLFISAFQGKTKTLDIPQISDLAILAPTSRVTGATLSIATKSIGNATRPPQLLFQTELACRGCGEMPMPLLSSERGAKFRLILDAAAAAAAQPFFSPDNMLVISLNTATGPTRHYQVVNKRDLRFAKKLTPTITPTPGRLTLPRP